MSAIPIPRPSLDSSFHAQLFRISAAKGQDPRGDIARVIASADGMDLLQLSQEQASLEEVFRKLTTTTSAGA